MQQQEVSKEAFQVIGIKTRTSNPEEMKGAGKIGALWNQFYSQQVLNKIPGKLDHEIIAVYYEYESDATAPYSVLVGARVAAGTKPPAGMELITMPAQKYFQLATRKGEMPGIIIEAWGRVWDLAAKSELNRKYSYDLEVYDERAANPKAAEANLFIAIK